MSKFFPIIASVTLTLTYNSEVQFVQDIVAQSICVKLFQNMSKLSP